MKNLIEYINERGPVKLTNGNGSIEMIKLMIDELKKKPDYKGKDKELWDSAANFLYDYLKELSNSDYEKIVKELNLADLRNNKDEEFSVQGSIELKLQN